MVDINHQRYKSLGWSGGEVLENHVCFMVSEEEEEEAKLVDNCYIWSGVWYIKPTLLIS